ncbi:hypothetical protein EGW08_001879, partial [Elysia chlorotica]
TPQDSGVFTVTVINPAGSDSATAELEVFEKPKLLTTQMPEWEKPLEDLVIRQGDTAVEITCSSKDLKNPTVRWFLNDQELFSGFHTQLQHEGQLVKLTIKEVRESDAGQVKCVMTGTNGELESACSVVVRPPEKMEAPVFVTELHDMEVEEGDKLELDVRVKGTPPVDVYWYHNDVAIARENSRFTLASLDQSVHTLTIPRATRDCSGQFVCEAYNAFGDTDTFCLVHVQEVEDPEPPSFVTRPLTLIAQEGESVTLACRVRGQPAPSVLWERQGMTISSCDKYQTANHLDEHSLTIHLLEASDAGLYVCRLHSPAGEGSHTCELRVEQQPVTARRGKSTLTKPLSREPLKHGPNSNNVKNTVINGSSQDNWRENREMHSTIAAQDPPTPKPRLLIRDGSQTSIASSCSTGNQAEESFVFPSLRPVISSVTSDKSKADSVPSQTDFRSVLKPRSQGPVTAQSTSAAQSDSEPEPVDFRSVLSKSTQADKDQMLTAGGFPRTDPVGVELRNLQMARTSRNVAFRNNEPKFGVSSLVRSRDPPSSRFPLSSGSKVHSEVFHSRPSAHVNATGLRIVSKNLETLDAWDHHHQQSSGQLQSSALGDMESSTASPNYSPSSCSSVSQNTHSDIFPARVIEIAPPQTVARDLGGNCSDFISQREYSTNGVSRFDKSFISETELSEKFKSDDGQCSILGKSSNGAVPSDSTKCSLKSNVSCLDQSKINKCKIKTHQEQEESPPSLPTSSPPLPSFSQPSNSDSKDTGGSASTKCVSFMKFTPSTSKSASLETSPPLQPVVFNFTLPDSSLSTKLKENPPLQEEAPGVSDSSRDESDDVFTDNLEVALVDRRGSIKASGSVFAWEKISSKSPERSPVGDDVNKSTETCKVAKKKTCFNSNEVLSEDDGTAKSLSSPSGDLPSSVNPKSVSSDSPNVEFTKIKLRSTGIKAGPACDLKKSKFLSTSNESLFFNVKLKPVAIKDVDFTDESSLSKNSWSIKAKSKSSGDILKELNNETTSRNNGHVQTARDPTGFSEKLSAFENKGSETDRTEISRKANYTIPKRNANYRTNQEEIRKLSGVPIADNRHQNVGRLSKFSSHVSDLTQPKSSSTLPKDHKAPAASRVAPTEHGANPNRLRHSVDIVSRMETVPNWVKEKALGKRASVSTESGASTLPMKSNNSIQNTRDRIAKLKGNPDAPKTPRRFKRDQALPVDRLSKTLGSDDLPGRLTQIKESNRDFNKTTTSSAKPVSDKTGVKNKKPWLQHNSQASVPQWTQRRNLKPVDSENKVEARSTKVVNDENTKSLDTNSNATAFTSLISKFNQASSDTPVAKHRLDVVNSDRIPKNDHSRDIESKEEGSGNTAPDNNTRAESNTTNSQSVIQAAHPSTSLSFVSKSRDSDQQETQHKDSHIRGKQPTNKGTETLVESSTTKPTPLQPSTTKPTPPDSSTTKSSPPQLSTSKQTPPKPSNTKPSPPLPSTVKPPPTQDLLGLHNQPPLRSTAVRPAWMKQRSLRHIPIYPIHDNELSPRHEPFVDDSESTASISSTSSEASIITNDSGYYSRSRANTSDLKPYATKDFTSHIPYDTPDQHKHNRDIPSEINPRLKEHVRDGYLQKQLDSDQSDNARNQMDFHQDRVDDESLQQVEGDEGFYQEDHSSHKLITPATSVIDHTLHHTKSPVSSSTNKESSGNDMEYSVTDRCDLTKDSRQAPSDTETVSAYKELKTAKLTGTITENSPGDKNSSDFRNSDTPTRQSLNLKNKVSYLDSQTTELETDTERVSFPRRRSKFLDNYMNARRGSDGVNLDGEEQSGADTTNDKPTATRPKDLDIVPKWRRPHSVYDNLVSSENPKVQEETYSTRGTPPFPLNAVGLKESANGSPERTTDLAPAFTELLDDTKEVVYGSRAILKCTVSGYPSPDVQWLFNRATLQPSSTLTVSRTGDQSQLTLSETFPEHQGCYTCRASNPAGFAETSCVLTVAASEKSEGGRAFEGPVALPPRIVTLTPKVVSLPVGSPLTLTTTFSGEPAPTVTWLLAGRELVPDERIHLENQRGSASLTIDAVRRSEGGKMSVCLSNSVGTDQASVNVCLEDAPDAPIGKPQVYDLGRTSVSLSWCGPASSGGNNVTHYSIEARTRQNGVTWDVVVSQCKELTCHILDLKPCTSYQFRVRAANRHGLGPPSEPSERVTTFDLFASPSDYESDGFSEVFSPSIEYREDELPFEPRHVTFNTEDKFESVYELDKEVGKGKFGTVYKCRHRQEGSTWAAKIVKCRPRDKAALRMEVDIMNKLRHPKLLMLWDAFESERQMILVMEYVGAGELFERVIGEDFVLTERDCIHFLRQICEGVAYMHQQCVLHLDLKPENILCLSENSNRIKIIDFGLARHHTPGESMKVLFGTPEFIAPEVINYDEISFATDMWSIGVICYVLLSGLSPFLGDSDTDTLSMVTAGEFDFDDDAFDEISDQAKDFISKLLVKNKDKRNLTAACLKHPWLNQDEVDGARYKRLNTDRLKRFMVRRKWLKTGNAVLAVSRLLKTTSVLSRLGSTDSATSDDNTLDDTSDSAGQGGNSEAATESITKTAPQLEESSGVGGDGGRVLNSNCCVNEPGVESTARCGLQNDRDFSDSNNNNDNSNSFIAENQRSSERLGVPSKSVVPSDSHDFGLNHSTSTQITGSSASTTSSLTSPMDAHHHPSGLSFSKTMANCKACKGDAARFDIAVSGNSLPLRLNTSEVRKFVADSPSENSKDAEEILVSWYFDGEQIFQDVHYQMSGTNSSSGNFSLIIRSVREEDEGEYSCRVHFPSSGEDVLLCCRADLSVLNI